MGDQNTTVTAEDILKYMIELGLAAPTAVSTDTSQSTTKKTKSTSYKQYSVQQVSGLAEDAFREALGRTPTADELKRFQNKLNYLEQVNPTVNEGTAGTSNSSTVVSGGVDATQLAKEELKLSPEYANYQKATTYFNTMIDSLRGPVGGGM